MGAGASWSLVEPSEELRLNCVRVLRELLRHATLNSCVPHGGRVVHMLQCAMADSHPDVLVEGNNAPTAHQPCALDGPSPLRL